jgi:hypothetical protein
VRVADAVQDEQQGHEGRARRIEGGTGLGLATATTPPWRGVPAARASSSGGSRR